jgi:hypothetical protein
MEIDRTTILTRTKTTNNNNDDARCGDSSFVRECAINKLQPIALAIQRAAANVMARHHSSDEYQRNGTMTHQGHRAVPIVFNTITPLLHIHGVKQLVKMLKSLRVVYPLSVLSPIIVSVLHELLRPSEERLIKDVSDAMVHIRLFDAPSSNGGAGGYYGSSVTATDVDSLNTVAVVISGVMDLARRGGGGDGMGGGRIHATLRSLPKLGRQHYPSVEAIK